VPALVLACLAYFAVALPGSALGLLWPSMRASFGQPVGALGILLTAGVIASALSSSAAGSLLARFRVGTLVAWGTALPAVALAVEALAPSLWVVAIGFALFGLGFGVTDAVLNVHAAGHFGARQINWMHASYGLGATIGPLVVTAILAAGLGWRLTYGAMAILLAVLAAVLATARRAWRGGLSERSADDVTSRPGERPGDDGIADPTERPGRRAATPSPRNATIIVGGIVFTAVEAGIESGAGIWGFVFLTAGRGIPAVLAGVAVSGYWATMFAGRAVLGPVAERLGAGRVLTGAVAGVAAGAALMAAPGPAALAVTGLLVLGLAAAPVFPLFTLTTRDRLGAAPGRRTAGAVSLQVASSAVGSAALPAGIGLLIGVSDATALAPALLALSIAMGVLYGLLARSRRPCP